MKLTYRGNTYEQSAFLLSSDRPEIKLIYRGQIYYTTPPAIATTQAVTSDGSTATLIYRGTTYKRQLQPSQLYRKPQAVNWRYQPEEMSPL